MDLLLNVIALPVGATAEWERAQALISGLELTDLDQYFAYWGPGEEAEQKQAAAKDFRLPTRVARGAARGPR